MMTKQDYIAIANAIKTAHADMLTRWLGQNEITPQQAKETYFHYIAQVLMQDNPRFNIETFAKACNIELAPNN